MKKLIAGIGLASLVLVGAGSASAATCLRITDSSSCLTTGIRAIIASVTNTNTNATVTNSISSNSNSGTNAIDSDDDQSGTTVTTGATETASLAENTGLTNANLADVDLVTEDVHTATDVGDESTAVAVETDTVNLTDNNNNDSLDVVNAVAGASNSGTNSVDSGDSLTETTVSTGASLSASATSQTLISNIRDIIRRVR